MCWARGGIEAGELGNPGTRASAPRTVAGSDRSLAEACWRPKYWRRSLWDERRFAACIGEPDEPPTEGCKE